MISSMHFRISKNRYMDLQKCTFDRAFRYYEYTVKLPLTFFEIQKSTCSQFWTSASDKLHQSQTVPNAIYV